MKKEIKTINKGDYILTNHRVHCRRGVIWLGQTCNQKCSFCYFADKVKGKDHPEHPFMSLEKAKSICKAMVEKYNNNSVDIQGGEPTIYKDIFELIKYCNEIGLKPTLITNALILSNKEKCLEYKEAGVYDFLVSVHALRDTHDEVVGVPGAHNRQMQALDNLKELKIPFRFNTVLTKNVLPQLKEIAEIALEKGARACNFIAFNPSADQDGKRNKDNVPKYSEIVNALSPVLDYLEENEIEVNLRYLPFCIFEEKHRKFVQNNKQTLYDIHEWEMGSTTWSNKPAQRQAATKMEDPYNFFSYVLKLRKDVAEKKARKFPFKKPIKAFKNLFLAPVDLLDYHKVFKEDSKVYKPLLYRDDLGEVKDFSILDYAYNEVKVLSASQGWCTKGKKCEQCKIVGICDGFHHDYVKMFGFNEAKPIFDKKYKIYDPRFYMYDQMKVVEKEEFNWARPRESK